MLARGGHHVPGFVNGAHANRAVLVRLIRGWWWGFLLVVPTEIRSGLGLAQARQLGPAHDGLAKAGRHHDVRIVSMGYKAPVQPYMDPLFKLILPAHYRLVCSWNIWGLAICQSLFECP